MLLDSSILSNPNNVAILCSVFGLLFTTSVAAFAYIWKAKAQDRRDTRRVLYLLLEVRVVVQSSIFQVESLIPQLANHIQKRLETEFDFEFEQGEFIFPEAFQELVSKLLRQIIEIITPEFNDDLLAYYADALDTLSTSNPLLAHKLKGRPNIQAALMLIREYNKAVDAELLSSIESNEVGQVLTNFVDDERRKQFEGIARAIDEDVLLVASKSGIGQRRAVKRHLALGSVEEVDLSELDVAFDTLLVELKPLMQEAKSESDLSH